MLHWLGASIWSVLSNVSDESEEIHKLRPGQDLVYSIRSMQASKDEEIVQAPPSAGDTFLTAKEDVLPAYRFLANFTEALHSQLAPLQLHWRLQSFSNFIENFPDNIANGAGGAEAMYTHDGDGNLVKSASSKHAALYAPGRVLEVIYTREQWIREIKVFLHSIHHLFSNEVLSIDQITPHWFIRTMRSSRNLTTLIAEVFCNFRRLNPADHDPGPDTPQRVDSLWESLSTVWPLPFGILGSDEKREPIKARLLMVPKRKEQACIDSHALGQSEKRLAQKTIGTPPTPQAVLAMRGRWSSSCVGGNYQGIPPGYTALLNPHESVKIPRNADFHRHRKKCGPYPGCRGHTLYSLAL